MSDSILSETSKNKFLLILLEEKKYPKKLAEIIKSVEKENAKICYVCLSKPYDYVLADIRNMGVDSKKFFFIDVMSSHYKKPKPVSNCLFLSSPTDLGALKAAIRKAIEEKKCGALIFDTISALLIYQESFSLIQFVHSLASEKMQENIKKLFIVIKGQGGLGEEDSAAFAKDLEMFADRKLEADDC
jgi:hypothetical protein